MLGGTNAAAGSSYTGWYTTCQRSSRSPVSPCAAFFGAVWYTICQHAGRVASARHGSAIHSGAASGAADCSAARRQRVTSRGDRGMRRGLQRVAWPDRQPAPLVAATSSGAPLIVDGTHVHWLHTRCCALSRSARCSAPWRSRIPAASSRYRSSARGPPDDAGDRSAAFSSRKTAGGQPLSRSNRGRAHIEEGLRHGTSSCTVVS
jgi:hypothetical protein